MERPLESLNPSRKEIDELWAIEAGETVAEVDRGDVETVPRDEVFRKLRERLDPSTRMLHVKSDRSQIYSAGS